MLLVLNKKTVHVDLIATRSVFFCAGFITAAWAAMIPFVKLNTQINDGIMGLMLLCLGAGALIGMPISGYCTSRYGCKRVLLSSVLCVITIFPVLMLLTSVFSLIFHLFLFGLFIGIIDCSMNIQAVVVERAAQKSMMSGFHGFYSLGGMTGAIILTILLSAGLDSLIACLCVSFGVLFLIMLNRCGFIEKYEGEKTPLFLKPKGQVLLIGVVCFVFFLAEGTVLDWSGIFLTEYRSLPLEASGLGIACFSVAMTISRLFGDKAINSLGRNKILYLGCALSILGFLISLLSPQYYYALIGYVIIGIGCSNIIPIMFSAAGNQPSINESAAVTSVSTISYIGVLAGPALVGIISNSYQLIYGLFFVVVLITIATVLTLKVKL